MYYIKTVIYPQNADETSGMLCLTLEIAF